MDGRFIAYYRVSTAKQGRSGLGLDAQKAAVLAFLNGGDWTLLAEFTEVESGKNNQRTELDRALKECRLTRATLLIAKLDRLSRDAHFLCGLEKAGIDFVACDMPTAQSDDGAHYGRRRGGRRQGHQRAHQGGTGGR